MVKIDVSDFDIGGGSDSPATPGTPGNSLLTGKRSAFKNISGKKWMTKEKHENLKIGTGQKLSNIIQSNHNYFAYPYQSGGSGVISYKRWNDYGKEEDIPDQIIYAHKNILTDFNFSPFKDNDLLISSSVEDIVKIWKLKDHPEDALIKGDLEIQHEISSSINRCGFHPKVKEIIYTSQVNGNFNFIDLNENKEKIKLETKKVVDSISFSYLGNELCTSHSDKTFKLFDIRSSTPFITSCQPHTSSKSFSVEFTKNKKEDEFIFTCGFDKLGGGREFTIWDRRKLDKYVSKTQIDSGSSFFKTFFDWDNNLIYLSGKGDREIKFYEIVDKEPYIEYLTEYKSNSPNATLSIFPKSSLNVMKHEISRFLKLTNENSLELISFNLLRNETIDKYFQEDIFPDTWDEQSSMSSFDYFNNKEIEINKISLKPENEISIFDVDEEKGGKKREDDIDSPTSPKLATKLKSSNKLKKNIHNENNIELIKDNKISPIKKFTIIGIPFLSFLLYYWRFRYIIIPLYLYLIYFFYFKKENKRNKQEKEKENVKKKVEKKREMIETTEILLKTEEEIIKDERSSINLMKKLPKITKDDLLAKDYGDETLKSKEFDLVSIIKGKDKVLYMIKGRIDYRMKTVPISKESLYNDLSLILHFGNKIYVWNGAKVNKFQQAHALDIATSLKFKEQSGNGNLIFIDQKNKNAKIEKEFLFLIGISKNSEEFINNLKEYPESNDEFIDNYDKQVRFYQIKDDEINDLYFKGIPHKSILESEYCYIYSNLSEVFVWQGKKSTMQMKRISKAIGKKISNELTNNNTKFVIYAKEIESGESTLFKEKFIGFPSSLPINISTQQTKGNIAEKKQQKKLDLKFYFDKKNKPIKSKLEDELPNLENGILNIEIIDMEKHDKSEYPKELYGQFFNKDAYIIHFSFQKVEGGKYINKVFFWQGKKSKRNTKGTSAYKTVEFTDKLEESEQIRVIQGKEPLNFLKLFKNKYIIHQNSYFKNELKLNKIYQIKEKRNNISYGIELDEFNLNYISSNYSYIILKNELSFIFNGKYSNEINIKNTEILLKEYLKKDEYKNINEIELFELFNQELNSNSSLEDYKLNSRLFQFSDQTGMVEIEEMFYFDQIDLDSSKIYLLDSYPNLFLWIGKNSNFKNLKKISIESTLEYSKYFNEKPKEIKIVNENEEPKEFILSFHSWSFHLKNLKKWNIDLNNLENVIDFAEKLKFKYYSLQFLKDSLSSNKLPEGIKRDEILDHLDPKEYKFAFEMEKDEFEKLPKWKSLQMKKKLGLF
eukprot:gene1215-11305_t